MKRDDELLQSWDELLAANFTDMSEAPRFPVDRREFVKLLGAGIVILFAAPGVLTAQRGRPSLPDDFNAFLRIGEDGKVTGFTGKIEMGQGVITSLAQMLADELDVPLDSVEMVLGDTDLCPWDMGTFGSMTTRFFGPPFRAAAAEAKGVLVELAAERLQVPVDQLTTRDGIVSDSSGSKTVTYAELAKGQRIVRRMEEKPKVESPEEFTVVGNALSRRDAVEKVTGKAIYAADVRHPGMLHARILRPPAHGVERLTVDTSAVKEVEGAQVVEDKELLAVLHEVPDLAEAALARVKATYSPNKSDLDEKNIFDHLVKVAPPPETVAQGGDLATGFKEGDQTVEFTYLDGYVAHAPMEPHAAVAKVEGDRIFVWASTQTPFRLKDEVAAALGIEPPRVRIIPPFVGGGFGGKSANQQGVEAARLAWKTGKPVQVAWTREEEFFFDIFRPAAVVKIKSAVTSAGKLTAWDYNVYFAGQRGSEQYYDIPHHQTKVYNRGWQGGPGTHPFGTGAWRAPSNNTNSFARESQIDMVAAKIGMDPLEFRLKNLKDPRMIRVLEAVAEKFGWKPGKAPSGRGWGIATGIDAGAYVAHMAEVDVDKKSGNVRVKRVVCAQEMGLCINPEGATIQMEGCIMMGLGYALSEEIRFKGGDILDRNFGTYQIPRFSTVPQIETVILDARNDPPQGGGEPAIICMGGLVANAVYDLTGARVLELPLSPDRVKEAMSRA